MDPLCGHCGTRTQMSFRATWALGTRLSAVTSVLEPGTPTCPSIREKTPSSILNPRAQTTAHRRIGASSHVARRLTINPALRTRETCCSSSLRQPLFANDSLLGSCTARLHPRHLNPILKLVHRLTGCQQKPILKYGGQLSYLRRELYIYNKHAP